MKNLVRVLAVLLVLVVLPMIGMAGEATVTCVKPTKNSDGTTLTDLGGLRYLWGTNNLDLRESTYVDGANLPCSYTVKNLSNATWYFAVIAYKTNGIESDLSNVVSKVVNDSTVPPPSEPLPPGTVVVSTEVFQVIATTDEFKFLPVGTVSASTVCIGTQTINGYYAVPVAAVTWYGSVRPKIVVAKCN